MRLPEGECEEPPFTLETLEDQAAVATFWTNPALRSSWVMVCDPVHGTDWPGSRSPEGHDSSAATESVTVTGPEIVTFPEFVTR